MKRRQFITLVGATVAWPLVALSQQVKGPVRIGFLFFGSPSNTYDQSLVEAFRQGLREAGLIEGRDIVLDVAWISGNPDQAVADVLQRGAELLVPSGSSASVAANRQAGNTPIVFISVGNPMAMGLVNSLSHPGRNATGFSDILADLGESWWTLPSTSANREPPLLITFGIRLGRMVITDIKRPSRPPTPLV